MSKRKNGFNPFSEVHNRYLIRRFSVGTASMLIGATLFFGMQLDLLSAHAQEDISIEMQGSLAEPETLQEILDQVVEVESVAPVAEEAIEVEETLEVSVEETVTQEVEEVAEEVSSEETNTSEEKEEVAEEKVVEEVQVEEVAPAAPVQEEKVQAPVQQAAQTSVQEETTATKETVEEDPRFVPLNEQLDAGIDPLVVAEAFLGEVYSPEDVTGILNFVAPAELQGLRGRDFIERIVLAGQEYANNSLPFGHAFATMPKEITVADGLQIINPQIVIAGEGRNENSIRVTKGGYSEIHFDFAIPNNLNVQLGDYFVIDGSRDKMKLTPDSSRLMSGNDVVADIVRISPYQLRVVFTDFVNTHTDVSGSIHYGARPDYYDPMYAHGTRKINVTTGDGSYRDNELFTLGVDVAGQRVEKQGVAIDYGMRRNRKIYLGGYTREVIDGELKDTVNIILNPGGTKYNTGGGIMVYPPGQYVVTLYDPNGTPINLNEVSYKVYRTRDADNITENFYPDVNDPTKFEDITHLSIVKDISKNGKFRLSLYSWQQPQGESIVIKVAIPEGTMPRTIKGEIRGPSSFGTQYYTMSLTSVQYDSSADGQRVVEENGFFIERHEYITLDQSGRIVSSETDVSDMQSGKNYEYFRTEQQLKDGFKLQNVTPTTIANADGSPAAKPFIPGELQQVTYTYARTVETPPETDSSQDHLTFEMIEETKGYETQYVLNPQLNPGQIQVKQRGQIGREKVLYEHVDPAVTSNFNPDNFVEFRGQYWREVSREIIQPVQNEIVEYNFVSIVSSEKNPDGGVTIHYNDGTKIIIPGPDKPAEPNDPLLPNEPMIKVEENVQDNAGNIGTKVTVEIFNPNTKEFESQREFFIKHGQDGQDGIDGESPTVDVQNNGDGSHTITITNPDGTETKTTVYDGAKGDKGDPGQDGAQGTDGKSAYDIWLEEGNVGTEQDFLDSLKGEKGDQGDRGEKGETGATGAQGEAGQDGISSHVIQEHATQDGKSGTLVTVWKTDANNEIIPGSRTETFIPDGADGINGKDGNFVRVETEPGTNNDGDTGVWIRVYTTKLNEEGVPTEELTSEEFIRDGKDGSEGAPGATGDTSKSAYDIWIDAGNEGTEQDFLDSLRGEKGEQGLDGNDGINGTDGKSAYDIWIEAGNEGTEQDFLDSLKGEKGDKGDPGADGGQGADGKDGATPNVTIEPGWDDQNNPGRFIIFTHPDTGEELGKTFIKDAVDGKDGDSIRVETTPGTKGDDTGVWIYVYQTTLDEKDNPTEELVSEEFIRDGKDGQSPKAEVKDNGDGTHTLIVTNPNGTTTETIIQNGTDGNDGLTPTVETQKNQDGSTTIIIKDGAGEIIDEIIIRNGEKGAKGDKGEDGKSATAEVINNGDGTHTLIVTNPDGTKTEILILDGAQGEDGKDGLTPTVETVENADGLTTIIIKDGNGDTINEITVRDGKNGKDGISSHITQERTNQDGKDGTLVVVWKTDANGAVIEGSRTETFIADGVDGKTPSIETEPVVDETGQQIGVKIIVKDGNGDVVKEETVLNGQDGKDGKDEISSHITQERTQRDGKDGTLVVVWKTDANGDVIEGSRTETFIADGDKGEDGKTLVIDLERFEDEAGNTGTTIIVRDPDTNEEISREVVYDGKDGLNGQDGKDGVDGESPTVDKTTNEDGSTTITITNPDGSTHTLTVANGKDGEDGKSATAEIIDNGDGTHTLIMTNPNGTTTETTILDGAKGEDGKDGLTPTVETHRNDDGSTTIIIKDGNGEIIDEITVKDGKDGLDGIDGIDGENGKSPTVGTTTNEDGSTTITITNLDGTTHTFTVENGKDRADGKDGIDGKSPTVEITQNKDGSTTIVITNPDGSTETFTIRDGKDGADGKDGIDGKSPIVDTKTNDDGSTTIIITNPDGSTHEFTVENGKDGVDGKSPTVDTVTNDDGSTTTIITNPDGSTHEFTVENGKDGADGNDGVDGKSPTVETTQNDDGSTTIVITNPDGSTQTFTVKDGKDGLDGQDGKDGVDGVDGTSPTVDTTTNEDVSITITITNPDGSTHTFTVENGKDGEDGLTPSVETQRNDDGSTTIIIKDGNGQIIDEITVRDGEDGKDGKSPIADVVQNADGSHTVTITKPDGSKYTFIVENGEDGKSPTVDTTTNADGSTTITITNPDGTTHIFTVENGRDGEDGKSPTVDTVTNADGSTTITITKPDGTTQTFTVKDGKDGLDGQDGKDGIDGKDGVDGVDGKSPIINITQNPDGSHTVTVINPDSSTNAFIVENGEDGKSPTADVVQNADGSHTVTINNPDGTHYTFVVENGQDGKDGVDGKFPIVNVEDNGDGTHTITIINPDGSKTTTVVKDGKDGEAPTISTTENADGSHTVTVENPDGSTHSFTVKKGKDGLDGKDGVDGQDGIDGIDGKSPTINITQNPDGSHTITVVNPDGTTNEFVVEKGEDGKSPTVSTTENADGSHTITIINPDGSTHSFIVKNGKDGADGQDGKDGVDGKDGQAPTVNITDNGDGSHTVTIINPDGTKSETTIYDGKTPTVETRPGEGGTHIIFRDSETGEILTETFIRDGKDGKDGKHGVDGKTPTIETVPEKDAQGNLLGYWIITKDGDGREVSGVFVQDGKDGKDGLSPTVKVEEGRNHKGESGQWIIVFDGNGNEISRDFVRDGIDGKDGESYVIETQPGRNEFGQTGIWVITRNEKGEEISLHFVRDGIDGKDGKDGEDGRGIVKIINKNNQLIVVYNDFTTEIIEIPCPETPEKPEEPEVPETPEQPGKPEEPETPEVPETPEQPGEPEEPETPEVPETPEEPETPEVPETPEQPAQPNEPTEDEAGHPSSDKATVLPNTGDQSLMTFSFLTLLSGLGVTLSRRKEQ